MSDRIEMLLKRLENPPFGTETSERLLMKEAADRIRAMKDALGGIANAGLDMFAWELRDQARDALK